MLTIESLNDTEAAPILPALISLLHDAVESGASIGFLPPLEPAEAAAYWQTVIDAIRRQSRLLWIARLDQTVVGSVQLDLCDRANGLHRAEVMKLMVHSAYRRQGLGRALMTALEAEAHRAGRTTLVLDTRQGDPSEQLYLALGYARAGAIPRYAQSADGSLHTTVFFYRLLNDPSA
jgi:ribosomal protein S18 acetylase RimI-like enzyme